MSGDNLKTSAGPGFASNGWEWTTLGAVSTTISKGTTPTSIGLSFTSEGVPFVRAEDVNGSAIDPEHCALKISNETHEALRRSQLLAGDLLITIAGTLGRVGYVPSEAPPLNCNQAVAFARLNPERIDKRFAVYLLQHSTLLKPLKAVGAGNSIQNLSLEQLRTLKIPLPAIVEQRRIAAMLNEQMNSIEQARKAAQEAFGAASALLDAHLENVFGSSQTRSWPAHSLEDIVEREDDITDGPFGSNLKTEHYQAVGARVVRLQNVGRGEFLDSDKAYVSVDHFLGLTKHNVEPNDIVLAALGDGARPAGRACLVPEGFGLGLVKADCFRVRLNRHVAIPEFVMAYLNAPKSLRAVSAAMRGATRPRVTLAMLRSIRVPVPSLADQLAAVSRIREAHQQSKQLVGNAQKMCKNISALPEALLRRAFAGQV